MSEDFALQVVRQIEEAFADTPYPGDANIGWDGIEDALCGKHWRELSPDVLFHERGELSFLTNAGFRFYLPAFMIAVLKHYDEVDTLPGNLIAQLCPHPDNLLPHANKRDFEDRLRQRTSHFSPAETWAVLAFLKSYRVLHPFLIDYDRSVYSSLLDSALEFWEAKAKDTTTK